MSVDGPADEVIAVKLNRLQQLFNTFDPSPFHEKELDRDAEAFIVGWLRDIGSRTFLIEIGLPQAELTKEAIDVAGPALRNHFRYREAGERRALRLEMRRGRMALLIGLGFLAICLSAREFTISLPLGAWTSLVSEGLLIIGWVAMWGPIEVFLYGWWPISERAGLYARLGSSQVRLVPLKV